MQLTLKPPKSLSFSIIPAIPLLVLLLTFLDFNHFAISHSHALIISPLSNTKKLIAQHQEAKIQFPPQNLFIMQKVMQAEMHKKLEMNQP